jgi:catechol 2,3-dioxygenase-like lactoylglutathione lyase family enzyme
MNVKGIAWLGIVSDDPAVRAFYADVLGLPVLDETAAYAYYAVNDMTHLEVLASTSGTAQHQRHDAPAVGFLVEDVAAGVAALRQAGVGLLTEVKEWRSETEIHRWVTFADPAGNILLLLERRRLQRHV